MTRFPLVFFRIGILLALPLLAFVACDDDATEPPTDEFSLEVEVTRPDGSPVEGLHVVVWNVSDSLKDAYMGAWTKRVLTAVPFTLPQQSICSLASYDLDGKLVQSVHAMDILPAGSHSALMGREVAMKAGVMVLRCRLTVWPSEGNDAPFTDSILMTAVQLDIDQIEGGRTDVDGIWRTTDKTMVPGLYDLPEMPATNEAGEVVGSFSIGNELEILVQDEQNGGSIKVEYLAVDGPNRVQIVWGPSKTQSFEDALGWGPFPTAWDEDEAAAAPPAALSQPAAAGDEIPLELRQNRPNPHN